MKTLIKLLLVMLLGAFLGTKSTNPVDIVALCVCSFFMGFGIVYLVDRLYDYYEIKEPTT